MDDRRAGQFEQPLDDTRFEIIDGELYVSTQPDWRHQHVGDRIIAALNAWSDTTGAGIAVTAPGVIFSPENAVVPDVVWVRRKRMAPVLGDDGKLYAASYLMVEILSPGKRNEQRDREKKLALSAKWGVLEYWIVDWRRRQVEVYRRQESELQLIGVWAEGDVIESPHLPGFRHDIGQVFSGLPGLWRPLTDDPDDEA